MYITRYKYLINMIIYITIYNSNYSYKKSNICNVHNIYTYVYIKCNM